MHVSPVTSVPGSHAPMWTSARPSPVTRMPHAQMSQAGSVVYAIVGTLATESPASTLTSVP